MNEPCDWDGISYCVHLDGNPATHRRLCSMNNDGMVVIDLLCCGCASKTDRVDAH